MTESDWLTATDPGTLFSCLGNSISYRKTRLLAVACCRTILHLLANEAQELLEIAERLADGVEARGERRRALARAQDLPLVESRSAARRRRLAIGALINTLGNSAFFPMDAVYFAFEAVEGRATGTVACRTEHAVLFRDVFDNPFRAVPAVDPAWLTWQGGTVPNLARAAYEERQMPEGMLDPARLGVLADALEDAGCHDGELLGHLRGPGPHLRGCRAIDALLGKA